MQIILWIAPVFVLIAAAYAGLGRLGEMPAQGVNDRPKGRIPHGPIDDAFLSAAVIPRASTGYDRAGVDVELGRIALGEVGPEPPLFAVVRGGYDMQVVDELLARERVAVTLHSA